MREGHPAPNVTLHLHTDETILLDDLWKNRVPFLFFYPQGRRRLLHQGSLLLTRCS